MGSNSLMGYAGTRRSKGVSIVTLVFFLVTSFINPGWGEASTAFSLVAPLNIDIPKHLGTIRKAFDSKNERSPLIVHIQDAHANYEAQKNISNILHVLQSKFGINTICVEGSNGEIDTSLFRAFPFQEAKERVIDSYVKTGDISAAEEYSIISEKPVHLIGVDHTEMYMDNVESYLAVTRSQDTARAFLAELDNLLLSLKKALFSDDFKSFIEQREHFLSGIVDPLTYTRYLLEQIKLKNINIKRFKHFCQLADLEIYQKKIKLQAIEKETRALIDDTLIRVASSQDTETLALAELDFRGERMSAYTYYTLLRNMAVAYDVDFHEYQNINLYFHYLSLVNDINGRKLMEERVKIEEELIEHMCTTEIENELYSFMHCCTVLKDMFSLKALPEDIAYFRKHERAFTNNAFTQFITKATQYIPAHLQKETDTATYTLESLDSFSIEEHTPLLKKFYSLAEKREDSFVTQTIRMLKDNALPAAVLLTGGYHTAGLERKLQKKGVSYRVVSPRLNELPQEDVYDKIMRSYDKYFGVKEGSRGGTVKQLTKIDPRGNRAAYLDLMGEIIPRFETVLESEAEKLVQSKSLTDAINQFESQLDREGQDFVKAILQVNPDLDTTTQKERVIKEVFLQTIVVPLWNRYCKNRIIFRDTSLADSDHPAGKVRVFPRDTLASELIDAIGNGKDIRDLQFDHLDEVTRTKVQAVVSKAREEGKFLHVTEQGKGFGLAAVGDTDALTTATVAVGDFKKFYLGKKGLETVPFIVGDVGMQELKAGWDKARFAIVAKNGMSEALGIVVEYPDGTYIILTKYAKNASAERKAEIDRLTTQYLNEEAKIPFGARIKGWEEIASGSVIEDAFTSRVTKTGLWAKKVPVIDPINCKECMQCVSACPEGSIHMNPVSGKPSFVDLNFCKGCGLCEKECPLTTVITMVDKKQVKAARTNVFTGTMGKRVEVKGDFVKTEVDFIQNLIKKKGLEKQKALQKYGFAIVYEDIAGEKSLSGKKILQVLYQPAGEEPFLWTFFSDDGESWTKIMRPSAHILIYGMSEREKEFASRLQLEGIRVSAFPASTDMDDEGYGGNKEHDSFDRAGITITGYTFEGFINEKRNEIDAVATAHIKNISDEEYVLITEKIGIFLAPFMPHFMDDMFLDVIIRDIEAQMGGYKAMLEMQEGKEKVKGLTPREMDFAPGVRTCAGCTIGTIFNMILGAVRSVLGEGGSIVNSISTGCAEVASTIFPDSGWRTLYHMVFGSGGANIEGINAAYRYLKKTGKIKKDVKIVHFGGDGGTFDIGLQSLSGMLERGTAKDSMYVCYDNGAYQNTGVQRSSSTPIGTNTTTSPIGEIIKGKQQFRKDLARVAAAHGAHVYVATVSPSHPKDLERKVKKAAEHKGPSLIICYSSCNTGHGTATNVGLEQSRLAVQSGFWPLIEVENGELTISRGQQLWKKGLSTNREERWNALLQWVHSEVRFAAHFNKDGSFKTPASENLFRSFFRKLGEDWAFLKGEDSKRQKKDVLMGILDSYLVKFDKHDEKTDELWFRVRQSLDVSEYETELALEKNGGLTEKQRADLEKNLYDIFVYEQEILQQAEAKQREETHVADAAVVDAVIKEDAMIPVDDVVVITMDESDKVINRTIIGGEISAARIFARAGDGGVTSAKSFCGLMNTLGIYAKASPDYGPERRGAKVGTNMQLSGKELRVQASADFFDISIVGNLDDPDWNEKDAWRWRNNLKDGGILVVNTERTPEDVRETYGISEQVSIYTFNATPVRTATKIPETWTLMGALLKALENRGIRFTQDYVVAQLEKMLSKDFAGKPEVIKNNIKAFLKAYDEVVYTDPLVDELLFEGRVDTTGFEQGPVGGHFTGSEAVAEAWRQINPGVFAFYPITPSTAVGEIYSKFVADGRVDTEYITTESEHSAFAVLAGAAASGVRAVASTASTGIEYGIEVLKVIPAMRLPVVINVGSREATNAPLNIHAGHNDIYALRDAGWIALIARNAQEAYDFAVMAPRIAEKLGLPVLISQDGFIVTHTKDLVDTLSDEAVQSFVGEYDPERSLLKTGGTYGPVAVQDYHSEHARGLAESQNAAPSVIEGVFNEFKERFGRDYTRIRSYSGKLVVEEESLIDTVGLESDTDIAIVCMGSTEGTAIEAVDRLRARGIKAGVVSIKTYRPFPVEEIRETLQGVRTVIVMDRANSYGAELTQLATEVQSALKREVLNIEYGRGGRNTPLTIVQDIFLLGVLFSIVPIESNQILTKDEEWNILESELRAIRDDSYVDMFLVSLMQGKFIKAFGPQVHIDVREVKRERDIKRRLIEKFVLRTSLMRLMEGKAESYDLDVIATFGIEEQKRNAQDVFASLAGQDLNVKKALQYYRGTLTSERSLSDPILDAEEIAEINGGSIGRWQYENIAHEYDSEGRQFLVFYDFERLPAIVDGKEVYDPAFIDNDGAPLKIDRIAFEVEPLAASQELTDREIEAVKSAKEKVGDNSTTFVIKRNEKSVKYRLYGNADSRIPGRTYHRSDMLKIYPAALMVQIRHEYKHLTTPLTHDEIRAQEQFDDLLSTVITERREESQKDLAYAERFIELARAVLGKEFTGTELDLELRNTVRSLAHEILGIVGRGKEDPRITEQLITMLSESAKLQDILMLGQIPEEDALKGLLVLSAQNVAQLEARKDKIAELKKTGELLCYEQIVICTSSQDQGVLSIESISELFGVDKDTITILSMDSTDIPENVSDFTFLKKKIATVDPIISEYDFINILGDFESVDETVLFERAVQKAWKASGNRDRNIFRLISSEEAQDAFRLGYVLSQIKEFIDVEKTTRENVVLTREAEQKLLSSVGRDALDNLVKHGTLIAGSIMKNIRDKIEQEILYQIIKVYA
ncbi:MAG: 2-oxoacid:acceptor oxidoreductase family protein [Candidatus Omnitrophica bacterium]|nr:2-oxoacid:acceptor oxidoreductase family protein [Candidatus Omnitrophota bacterium]